MAPTDVQVPCTGGGAVNGGGGGGDSGKGDSGGVVELVEGDIRDETFSGYGL